MNDDSEGISPASFTSAERKWLAMSPLTVYQEDMFRSQSTRKVPSRPALPDHKPLDRHHVSLLQETPPNAEPGHRLNFFCLLYGTISPFNFYGPTWICYSTSLSTICLYWNIRGIVVTFCADICGIHRIKPTDFSFSVTMRVTICFEWITYSTKQVVPFGPKQIG